ncbi:MAG: NAD(P)-dependent oxidoreductase [Pseudomonadota bacterium]
MVTGSTGFIGRHLVPKLLAEGHTVVALVRDKGAAQGLPWLVNCLVERFSLETADTAALSFDGIDAVVHLAWTGLPNYRSSIHETLNLHGSLAFLARAMENGVNLIQVAGTCLEYGLVQGALTESLIPAPTLPYPIAKDRLREKLMELATGYGTQIQWLRLFYMHGAGQNPSSLLPALERAICEGHESFDMSGGEQIRDYASADCIAGIAKAILETPDCTGVVNCCSGVGIAVKDLVNAYIHRRGAKIALNLGHYPYPDYEPMAFWGDTSKLESHLGWERIPEPLRGLEASFTNA